MSRQNEIDNIFFEDRPSHRFSSDICLSVWSDFGNVSTKELKLSFMLDIMRGLEFMHFKKVAHCHMKPANILADQDEKGRLFCALTDFGVSKMYSEIATLVAAFKVVNMRGASIAFLRRKLSHACAFVLIARWNLLLQEMFTFSG